MNNLMNNLINNLVGMNNLRQDVGSWGGLCFIITCSYTNEYQECPWTRVLGAQKDGSLGQHPTHPPLSPVAPTLQPHPATAGPGERNAAFHPVSGCRAWSAGL